MDDIFVVFTEGRTGSNLLLDLLQKHPKLGTIWEPFGEGLFVDKAIASHAATIGPLCFLKELIDAKRQSFKVIGVKILIYQLSDSHFDKFRLGSSNEVEDFLKSHLGIKIVYLKRENRLRRYLSQEYAKAISKWTLIDKEKRSGPVKVHLEEGLCRMHFQIGHESDKRFQQLSQGHQTVTITYEELVSDMTKVCCQVFELLGLEPCKVWTERAKQNVYSLADIIENYQELKQAFSGTEWEWYFEE